MYPSPAATSPWAIQQGGQLDALLAQFGRLPQQQMQQQPTAITDLNEFIGGLPADERKAIELDERYQRSKLGLIEGYLIYAITHTQDGYGFVTGAGRKQAQDLLDTAKKVHEHVEAHANDELTEMKTALKQQQEFIAQQMQLMEQQKADMEAQRSEIRKQREDLEAFKSTLGE